MNRSGSLLSSATTQKLEIWDTTDNCVVETVSEDLTGVSSMTWRADDSYYLGSHNSTIRYYRQSACAQVLRGTSAWIRSLALNRTEDLLIAGNVCSVIQLWSVETGQKLAALTSSAEDETAINVISSLATHPILPSVFLSGARDGKVSVWDVRCPGKLIWQFLAHSGKLSSLEFTESGVYFLSSGREGCIRLWDHRRLPPSDQCIGDGVMAYQGHETHGHWVPAHFLNLEKYVLTGSETSKAFIYETLTGRLMRAIPLGSSKVIFTEPVPESVAFYYVNLSTQTLGLCDVHGNPRFHSVKVASSHGEDAPAQEESPLQIRQNFLKEKMQEVMLDYSDVIIQQLAKLGVLEQTGLHQIIDALSRSRDSESHAILKLLSEQYEERLKSSQTELAERIMSHTVLPSSIFAPSSSAGAARSATRPSPCAVRSEPAPSVWCESGYSQSLPLYRSQASTGEETRRKTVERSCLLCHDCHEDADV